MNRTTFRELIASMADVFDSKAAGDLSATVQFRASGKEPGDYYLSIENGKCTFHEGVANSPTATIHTPSEVWIAITSGEMDPALAYMRGKFRVEGDLGLLLKMREIFKRS
ncbi:MAG TPA: SCP2 sterol-binding domain-containing protein [Candidatus Bathyarchaeia archaeon]|nr:SCP2 sterol-binding domain-containing protein [Candidatus Bathyarchaeia archaeon]